MSSTRPGASVCERFKFGFDFAHCGVVCLCDKSHFSGFPINALYLIHQRRAINTFKLNIHLERVSFSMRGDGAREHEAALGIVLLARNDKRWTQSSLFASSCRVEIKPNNIASVGNVSALYHISFPFGLPQSVSLWRFSFRISRTRLSKVYFRAP